jgi:hypothetical protein
VRSRLGDKPAAREAFDQAAAIVRNIAGNVTDERLRATFLNSPALREVLDQSSAGASSQVCVSMWIFL